MEPRPGAQPPDSPPAPPEKRNLALALAAGVVLSALVLCAVGVVPPGRTSFAFLAFLGAIVALSAACVLAPTRWAPVLRNVAVAAIASCLALAAADLALRVLLDRRLYYRPYERFLQVWPRMKLVLRFQAGASWEGETFGDLAEL